MVSPSAAVYTLGASYLYCQKPSHRENHHEADTKIKLLQADLAFLYTDTSIS